MVMDFKSILDGLIKYQRKPPQEIATPELVKQYADRMGRWGYKHTAESLEALADWLNGYGILLSGNVGVGKTFFFRCLYGDNLTVLSLREAFLWEYDEIKGWLYDVSDRDILIDDVGAEQRSKKFGEPFWLITLAMEYRLNSGHRTNFTTNFTSEELAKKYEDASIVDRVFELARGHRLLTEDSMREARPRRIAVREMNDTIFRP